jgi:hypothetical protein
VIPLVALALAVSLIIGLWFAGRRWVRWLRMESYDRPLMFGIAEVLVALEVVRPVS